MRQILGQIFQQAYNDTTGFDLESNQYGTYQFPERYGLIKIDDEIILYSSKDRNPLMVAFVDLVEVIPLVMMTKNTFSSSESIHVQGARIINLSNILLKKFFEKLKTTDCTRI